MANDNLKKDENLDASQDNQNLAIADMQATIEKLTFQNENYFDQYAASIDEIEKLKRELMLLKNQIMELENQMKNSIQIPCKIGDNVFDTESGIIERYTVTAIEHCEDGDIDIYCESGNINICVSPNDFGKRMFTTVSDARSMQMKNA